MKQRIFNTIVFFLIFTTSFFTAKAGDCEKPKNLKAESISSTEVRLSWTATADATAFRVRVEEGDDNDHDFDLEKIVSGNAFIVSGLHEGEQYEFRIRAICGDDHSNWVDDFIFYTSGVDDPNNPPSGSSCGIPSGLVITNISEGSATVSWNRVPGVNTYELEVEDGENTPAFNFYFNIVTGDTAVVVTGLSANGQYKAKGKSKCSGDDSGYSGLVFFKALMGSGLINIPSETTPIGKTVVAMEVFPNPAREEVKIRFYNNPQISETVYRIELRDLTGSLKKALTQPLMEDNLVRFPLHDLEPGLYILTKYSNKGRASVKVMVM